MNVEKTPAITPARPKKTVTDPTRTLLFLAARIRALREHMGIGLERTEHGERLEFKPGWPRPWLKPHPVRPEELTFDPDTFAFTVNDCSDGERWCRLFILNVWNRGYAQDRGWQFDLFKAAHVLDSGNMRGICEVLQSNPWP